MRAKYTKSYYCPLNLYNCMGSLGLYFFNFFITYYGLFIVIGIFISFAAARRQIIKFRLDMNDFFIIVSVSALCGIAGAKSLFLLTIIKDVDFLKITDLSYISSFMNGGFVFLGGLLGMLPALHFCRTKLNIPVSSYIQACIGCFPIGHAFGRVGCFFTGCCYGIPFACPLSVVYTQSNFAPNNTALFPVQLLEAMLELIIGTVLIIFSNKLKKVDGLFLYISLYSFCRFFLEFLRGDQIRGIVGGISISQIISIFLFLFSLFYFLNKKMRNS